MLEIPFPSGEILDRDGYVWVTLPPGTGIYGTRIVGTCLCDPSEIVIAQVTVNLDGGFVDLLSAGQSAPFPCRAGFPLVVPDLEGGDTRGWSTIDAPVRVTAWIRRVVEGLSRDKRGGLQWPEPITFQLVLHGR